MKKTLALFLFSCLSLQGCGGLDDIADSLTPSSSSKDSSSSGSQKDQAGNGTFTYTCKATKTTTQLPYITGKCEAVSKRYAIAQGCHEYGTLDKDACELETCGGQPKGSLGCGMYKEMDALPKGTEFTNTGSSSQSGSKTSSSSTSNNQQNSSSKNTSSCNSYDRDGKPNCTRSV